MKTPRSALSLWLVLLYIGLIVYASLYPFEPWRDQGLSFWHFATAPWPKYWSGFDVSVNVLGYLPLGLFVALAMMGTRLTFLQSLFVTLLLGSSLSFAMEGMQTYLDPRVSSNVDWLLNTMGVMGGFLLGWMAHAFGMVHAWRSWRDNKFSARGSVHSASAQSAWALGLGASLLLLWPLLLLYPSPIPLGLGHVFDPSVETVAYKVELAATFCGLLIPVLLGYALVPAWGARMVLVLVLLCLSVVMSTLATGLAYGAGSAWVWLREPIVWGLLGAVAFSLLLLAAPRRWAWVLLLVLVLLHVLLVNAAPLDPYYAQHLGEWEAGRFVRFYGVTQVLGSAWPFAVFALALSQLITHKK